MMKITVIGSGYVGLVAAVCFAEVGYEVICLDVDAAKIQGLQQGQVHFYEPGLAQCIIDLQKTRQLIFTTDPKLALAQRECIFIAVGTPSDLQGRADLSAVLACAQAIAENMTDYTVVVDKSTVPIGTADKVKEKILQGLHKRQKEIAFDVASNPEFLKEGSALQDFRHPDRIIVGVQSDKAEQTLRTLYAPFNRGKERFMVMDIRSAELTKYAANAMLATKISFINEMANLAEKVGADIEKVRQGIGTDVRIGPHFIQAGCGFGGSCFGKDIQALIHTANEYQCSSHVVQAVQTVNQQQKQRLVEKIQTHYQQQLVDKIFAVWGLSFKPGTDDMRDAPSRVVIQALLHAKAKLQVYDPQAMPEAKKIFDHASLKYCDNPQAALQGAHALIVLTEWPQFKQADLKQIKASLIEPVIFDGRNIFDPAVLARQGFIYYGIGRGVCVNT